MCPRQILPLVHKIIITIHLPTVARKTIKIFRGYRRPAHQVTNHWILGSLELEENRRMKRFCQCVRDTSLDIKTDTHNYTVTLGSCDEKKSKDTDKPKSCTLDPATGVCQ